MNETKGNGVLRRIDDLGRIVIPFEFRAILDLDSKSHIKLTLKDNGIFIENANMSE